jgi:NADH-quinone oxidoreductase subunit H
MGIDVAIACAKAVVILLIALQVMAMGVFFERKVSAIIQDRIGANRASIFGFAGHGLINTLVADPVKFLLKEDVRPPAPTACCTRSRP